MTALVRLHPWTLLRDLEGGMNQLLDKSYRSTNDSSEGTMAEWTPHVDVREDEEKFVILADLPGIDPKEIQVSMEDNTLTIQGDRKEDKRTKENGYTRLERFTGTFYRRFDLPEGVNAEGIQAKGKNGVLEVSIPKVKPNPPKLINVQVQQD